MLCANRLGGPGTSFAGPKRGAITLVANCPKGENLGPAATRSRKPTANAQIHHCVWKASVKAVSVTTIPATERAAYSLTGFGNVRYLLAIAGTVRMHFVELDGDDLLGFQQTLTD